MKTTQPTEKLEILLQREFVARCKKNPAYSLRAFAKYLDIDQSNLSKILKGKREVSKTVAVKIGSKLGLKPSTIDQLYFKAQLNDSYFSLADDEFDAISLWYHFAILELAKTKKFNPDPADIASRLGLHIEQARSAIATLQRLGFIRIDKKMWILNSNGTSWTNNERTTDARKFLQKNLLEKSLEALETVPFSKRDHGSVTIAVSKKRLPEFKEKLKQVRRDLADYFASSESPDEVYQLTMSFFPLSKIQGDSNE